MDFIEFDADLLELEFKRLVCDDEMHLIVGWRWRVTLWAILQFQKIIELQISRIRHPASGGTGTRHVL